MYPIDEDLGEYYTRIYDMRWHIKHSLPRDVHLPNKHEAEVLRRLMSQTGLTEAEIRQHKKYRKMLSEASTRKGTKTKKDRFLRQRLRWVLSQLKLPKEHPDVLPAFEKHMQEYFLRPLWSRGFNVDDLKRAIKEY